ncbi:3-hydroxy-2-methylbutyryl-CoA dehydrogenase [alpha proteobacterium AAP38]|uniref:3-oxoacyl-ACP reductase FabG n=1 Tax=Niveispirillum cyanobacteriorum TaxID=1612173 RepID=A0A2K9NGB5_9PROT|nr:SDR family NAD(P)-dependent oxidoreductase [Niveispirillum cyanobacteriorum]AUN32148.1 3-oxoacyl-ACP reductase FabG [Niveispirillum cyanobacteriorum]KPF83894.1 3-hydroxy-2-methylbutyryl-CoA dehydrogenase [alpha proteobacterium AAP38]GGE74691.1 3-hydroxyacyl-CoA dehydrogenase [Niveispirillum cyanobacteriorum]
MDIKGVSAIISGGGSGLGAATARALAAGGAKVALLDVNLDAANAVAAEIGGIAVKCDVTSGDSAQAAIAAAAAAHGPARIAVNCAGIAPPAKIVGRDGPHDLDLFRKVIEVNLIGTFNMLRLAAAGMQGLEPVTADGERGVIINTASVAAFDGQIGQAAYGASKGGVHALTLPAARELARSGIRVVTIAPGIFLTPMMLGLPQDAQDSLGKQVPFPSRLGKPEEYASLALHIVANSMINGETIRLDGAIRMAPK